MDAKRRCSLLVCGLLSDGGKKRGKFLLSQKKRSFITSKQFQHIHSFFVTRKFGVFLPEN
jgi:hypothetical protein